MHIFNAESLQLCVCVTNFLKVYRQGLCNLFFFRFMNKLSNIQIKSVEKLHTFHVFVRVVSTIPGHYQEG